MRNHIITKMEKIKLALVDDHILFRKALIELLRVQSDNYEFVLEASNGQEFLSSLALIQDSEKVPNVVLLDINMPVMNGFDTAIELRKNYPSIKILVLSAHKYELGVFKLIQIGICGYLTKDLSIEELETAVDTVARGHYYFNNLVQPQVLSFENLELSDKEVEFLKMCCSDYTYVEIADKMNCNRRTIEGFRESLFKKFNVQSRVGLSMCAIKSGLVSI